MENSHLKVYYFTGKKNAFTLLLNTRRAKEFVVTSTLTRCIMCALLFLLAQCTRYFLKARHQVKAITIIAIVEVIPCPVVEIVSVFLLHFRSTYMHMHIVID
jgi:hypothetical protein